VDKRGRKVKEEMTRGCRRDINGLPVVAKIHMIGDWLLDPRGSSNLEEKGGKGGFQKYKRRKE